MTTQQWWAIHAALVVGLISVACGGSDGPVDTGPKYKYPDYYSFCGAKAQLECTETVLARCQTTQDACEIARRGEFCAQKALAGATYRPTEAEACLNAVRAAYLDDEYTAEEKAAEAEACALLWGGAGGEGATCKADHHCDLDEDLRCVIGTNQLEGRCYVPQEKQPGQPCVLPDAVCVEGNFCTDSEPHVCANARTEGDSCSPVLPCEEGLRCVGEESAKCEAKYSTGTECFADEDCTSNMCSPIGDANQCVTSVILAPNEPICENFR